MKTLLHYLNWLLHDLNSVGWHFVKIFLQVFIVMFFFFGVPILVFFLTDSYDFASLTLIPLIVLSIFLLISFTIYNEKPDFIYDPEHMIGMYDGEPKSLKQSMKEGLNWTVYALFVLIISGFLLYLSDDWIKW